MIQITTNLPEPLRSKFRGLGLAAMLDTATGRVHLRFGAYGDHSILPSDEIEADFLALGPVRAGFHAARDVRVVAHAEGYAEVTENSRKV